MRRDGRHLDSEQLKARFGISKPTLYRWMKDPEMAFPKPFRVRKRYYWPEPEIEAWEAAQGRTEHNDREAVAGCPVVSGIIRNYADFVKAMVARRKELDVSCLEVDMLAGMQDSYTNKLENWPKPTGRGMGPEIFPLWLGGLRLGIVLVDLPRRPKKGKMAPEVDDAAAA